MTSQAVAEKIHPILGFSRRSYYCSSKWKVDFNNPIKDVFQGKISTSFICTGEVDGDNIELLLEPHAIKYADGMRSYVEDNNVTIQKEYESVSCYTTKNNGILWSKINDVNIEFNQLQTRLQRLSKKLSRGYGRSTA